MRVAVVSILFALSTAACGLLPWTGDDRLGELLIAEGPSGYELVEGATGPLDLDGAAGATAADPGRFRERLSRIGFQGGFSRIWASGDEFATALVFEVLAPERAEEVVEFQVDEHVRRRAVRFNVPEIPDGVALTLSAQRRDGSPLFCQIVWFPHDRYAFEFRVCGPRPGSPEATDEMAVRQFELLTDQG